MRFSADDIGQNACEGSVLDSHHESSVTLTVRVSARVARYLELLDVENHERAQPKAQNVLRRLAEMAAHEVRRGGSKINNGWLARSFPYALVEDEIFRQVAMGHLRVCPDGHFDWLDDEAEPHRM